MHTYTNLTGTESGLAAGLVEKTGRDTAVHGSIVSEDDRKM